VPPLDAGGVNVGAGGFADAQPVEGQQGDQRLLARRAEPSGDQQRTEVVAVEPGGVRVIAQPGAADMGRWGLIEQVFLDGVPVEAGYGAQAAGDGGPGAAAGFQGC